MYILGHVCSSVCYKSTSTWQYRTITNEVCVDTLTVVEILT
jgi:hypothetical protein